MNMTLMSLRECVLQFEKFQQQDGRVLYISASTEHPDYPVTNKMIRMDIFKVTMLTDHPGEGVSLLEFSTFSMGGWVPERLITMMMSAMIDKGVDKMMEKLHKF